MSSSGWCQRTEKKNLFVRDDYLLWFLFGAPFLRVRPHFQLTVWWNRQIDRPSVLENLETKKVPAVINWNSFPGATTLETRVSKCVVSSLNNTQAESTILWNSNSFNFPGHQYIVECSLQKNADGDTISSEYFCFVFSRNDIFGNSIL